MLAHTLHLTPARPCVVSPLRKTPRMTTRLVSTNASLVSAKHSGDSDKASRDNRSNQLNPNNPNYQGGKGSGYSGNRDKDDLDNHANQLNPNNPEYKGGKGGSPSK